MRIRNLYRLTLPLLAALLLWSCSDWNTNGLIPLSGQTMGTEYSVIIAAENTVYDREMLKQKIDSILETINNEMSTWRKDSEISTFNRSSDTTWYAVSSGFAEVVHAALQISDLTDGAMDITVEPLVNLWGFGPEHSRTEVPSKQQIDSAMVVTGYHHLQARTAPPAIKKDIPELQLDLSAIAKGYAVDVVADLLKTEGLGNFLVEIGGEVRTSGVNKEGEPWRVGVQTPMIGAGLQRILPVSGISMATSGDYRNYYVRDGVRYSHTINPATGKPIAHNLASVTVIAEFCMMADGLATAFDVLGADTGLEIAEEEGLAVFFIVREESGYVEKWTSAFEKYLTEPVP